VVLETLESFGPKAVQNARSIAGVFVCAAALLLGGCAGLVPQTAQLRNEGMPAGLPRSLELFQVPFFAQTQYQCGPAALAMLLTYSGVSVTPEALVPEVYIPERKGTLQVEMLAAARRHGRISYQLAPRLEDLLRELAAGNPVIVLQNLGLRDGWHYAVAIGYDYDSGRLILRSGEDERKTLRIYFHEFVWMRSGYWAMVTMPPERMPATADEERWLSAIAAFERTADAAAARTAYASFLKRWPQNTNAAVGLANSLHSLGNLREAEAVLREAERRTPDSVIVLNNLAQTLSDQGRNEEALPFIERATAAGGPFAEAVKQTREEILQRLARRKN
jgi:Peptidase_C39 like family/Tetratricopeptide repeat